MKKSPFFIPSFVLISLIFFVLLILNFGNSFYSNLLIWITIAVGTFDLLKSTFKSLINKSFSLDYIALLAISTGVITQNYLVAGVIVLMMSGGNALEEYAQNKAKKSLTALKNHLPNQVQIVDKNGLIKNKNVEKVDVGTTILIRKGEVVSLDGKLETNEAILDESSLTGESMPITRFAGEIVRSGSLNTGEVIKITTIVKPADSTYQQIVELVEEAEKAQAPFVQLADKLSTWFTITTVFMAFLAYAISGELDRSLAVLVIATPCPLILATPIALVGGMNAAAKQKIIFKQLASLETLAMTNTIIFDKTGTLTLGTPQLESITVKDKSCDESKIMEIAASIEKNSLHPFATAIVNQANSQNIKLLHVESIKEKIGVGLSGLIDGEHYELSSDPIQKDSQVVLKNNQKIIAIFKFLDQIKNSTIQVISSLQNQGFKIYIFTGDSEARAKKFIEKLKIPIQFKAGLSPVEKQGEIINLKKKAKVMMVGDGINDAPALASADIGLAFSHQQHTAASSAADVILLKNDISLVQTSLSIAKHTMKIAKQSIQVGMILSLIGMFLALFGKIPPIAGAVAQELIDVLVIFNSLRVSFWKNKEVF